MPTVTAIVQRRKEKLLTDVALVAHCLDHRFRGGSLERADRARALRSLPAVAAMLGIDAPLLDEVLAFIGERGMYSDIGQLDCHPYNVWDTVLGGPVFFIFFATKKKLGSDSPISDFGARLASLPSTQASVERAFSACTHTVAVICIKKKFFINSLVFFFGADVLLFFGCRCFGRDLNNAQVWRRSEYFFVRISSLTLQHYGVNWTTDGNREKMSFAHLVRDTKLRFNYNALQRKS